MCPLPPSIAAILAPFAPLFARRVWAHVQVLLAGVLLAPAQRTVAAALRLTGRAPFAQFHRDHRVLSHDQWSGRAVGRVLRARLVAAVDPDGPLVFGIDEPLARRRGKQLAATGRDRDAVRSGTADFVTVSAVRWVCLLLRAPVPWAARTWALPVLTALAPSARHDAARGRRHTPLPNWARQRRRVVRRWWPARASVAVADSGDAALAFLAACRGWRAPVMVVTRLRLDAALDEPAPPRRPRQHGRPRLTGARLPTRAAVAADADTAWAASTVANGDGAGPRAVEVASETAVWSHTGLPPVPLRWVLVRDPRGPFATQALRCTDQAAAPAQILAWFVLRWQLEVTLEEARRHLGVETQRQWSALAIRRTTPVLVGRCALVALLAAPHRGDPAGATRPAAWYRKAHPTVADAVALVRRARWRHQPLQTSACACDLVKVPRAVIERLTETLCYVA